MPVSQYVSTMEVLANITTVESSLNSSDTLSLLKCLLQGAFPDSLQ